MSNTSDNKAAPHGTELDVQLALKGLTASPPQQSSFTIGSVSMTLADLVAKFQGMEAKFSSRRDLEVQLANVRATIDQTAKADAQFLRDFRFCFRGMLGAENEELSNYGIKPLKKPRKLTAEERTLAVARNRATRQKRGTLGSKQKAAIRADAPTSVNVVRDANGGTTQTPPASGGNKTA
jgi:hypothetical protein